MNNGHARALLFTALGILIGGGVALLYGVSFGSGYEETIVLEFGVYVFCGVLFGGAFGFLLNMMISLAGQKNESHEHRDDGTESSTSPSHSPASSSSSPLVGCFITALAMLYAAYRAFLIVSSN
jgi:hypothetical protein